MKIKIMRTLVAAAFLGLPGLASAQHEISWWTVDGGGGASSGGVFSLNGSIGQPEGGSMAGGTFTMNGGFWGVVGIPTPGAPPLRITRMNDRVVVSWPKPASGWLLEQVSALEPQVLWTTVPAALFQTNAAEIYVVVSPPNGNRFYRLRK